MNTAFRHLILPGIVALAAGALPALAQDKPSLAATLDIDRDGKMDRAVMVDADLYIYLGAGDEKPDTSRTPSFVKKIWRRRWFLGWKAKARGPARQPENLRWSSNMAAADAAMILRRPSPSFIAAASLSSAASPTIGTQGTASVAATSIFSPAKASERTA
jgi:hypothetical protein